MLRFAKIARPIWQIVRRRMQYYTRDHEWLSIESGEIGKVGITTQAANALGDVVFVELPEVGTQVKQGDRLGVIESSKAANEFYSPISGKICEVNNLLEKKPFFVSKMPMTEGWLLKLKFSKKEELNALMDSDKYKRYIETGSVDHGGR